MLFSPFSILLTTLSLKCLLMNLLPQPNYSADKENFKNKLRWSHDIILWVQRSLTVLKCKLLSYLHQSEQIYFVKKPNYRITNNLWTFWFLWHEGEKSFQNALPFRWHFSQNRWSTFFEFTWSVMQMLHNNCDREFPVATWCDSRWDFHLFVMVTLSNLLEFVYELSNFFQTKLL